MGILKTDEQAYYATGGDHGSYRYLSLQDVINAFMATYVGEGKICDRVINSDVAFHATRALQELSYDTLKCTKDWEIEVPATLVMVMPNDYVNYVKLSWSDGAGIEHILYPTYKTSNPRDITEAPQDWGGFTTGGANTDLTSDESSDTWEAYKSHTPTDYEDDDYEDNYYWRFRGERYGIDPEHAQINGSFYIDEDQGKFHFSSNLSGKTLILKYISDGLVTNSGKGGLDLENTLVPKLAEEAIYKHILYGVLLARKDTPGGLLAEIKKQRYAETRKAKLRLSNIKLGEIVQVMRGSSKIIKH
jgi:hypothetical protein|tara:strand:+ start:419 stop:1327 length:909 start_codon:yes stop_codon:yes gene_type:complete